VAGTGRRAKKKPDTRSGTLQKVVVVIFVVGTNYGTAVKYSRELEHSE
jgi:hypothetical protein